jgi:siderophore synthetase component
VIDLLRAVLDTMLREDFQGLRTRSSVVDGQLRFGDRVTIPVRPDGFLCDIAVREPVVTCDGRRLTELEDVLALFRSWVDPADVDGFDAFVAECRDARTTAALQRVHRPAALRRTTGLRYEALAAYAGHPVYPTGLARRGISPGDQLRYAPEYRPTFPLHWAAVPAAAVTSAGTLPAWWPTADELGMSGAVVPFPVHPIVADGPALLQVTPTLSMRTVAVVDHPGTHVKLPLPTSTLGLLNRRTIKPGTLVDGAVTGRLLAAVLAREPRFADRILLADEQTYAHADDELLAFLIRRMPAGTADAEVVPLAALLAPTETGALVLDELAQRYTGGDRIALVTDFLALLLDFQITLLLRYGMALESHQQNVALVLDGTGIRLLFKDNDGPRLRADRLLAGLGEWPPGADPALLPDRRILVEDTAPLIDLFTTITLHLCAAAIVFGANGIDRGLVRELLCAAIERHPDSADRGLLIDRTLDADRLPVKAMVTAGTWLAKKRSGASDVNKFYRFTGPNYLNPRSG